METELGRDILEMSTVTEAGVMDVKVSVFICSEFEFPEWMRQVFFLSPGLVFYEIDR